MLGYVSEISPEQLQDAARPGLPRRRHDRPDRHRVVLRQVPARDRRAFAAARRLARQADQRRSPEGPGASRQRGAADARRQAAEGRRGGAALRDRPRAQLRVATAAGTRTAARSSRIDPHDGSIRALASYPTYRPSLFVGRVRQRALDVAGLTPRTAEAANFPALDRAIDGAYPPGSTFKPVTAIAAMQEHILQPFESLPCTGLVREERPGLQELGSVRERGDDIADGARQVVRHVLLPSRLPLLRDAVRPRAATAGMGEPLRLRPEDRNRSGLPSAAACCRHRTGGRRPTRRRPTRVTGQIDSLWKPGDSIQLAIGQKDLLVTPMQMARFYAMIANGGKLVTPHLLLDVEQPSSNGTPGRAVPSTPPPAPEPTNVDAQALAVVREGLYQATHDSLGTSASIFGSFPISDLRQDRNGGEEHRPGRRLSRDSSTSPGGAGTARPTRPISSSAR